MTGTLRAVQAPSRPAVTTVSGVVAAAAQEAGRRLWQEWCDRRSWKVSITDDDELYLPVQQWLVEHDDMIRRRALVARTHYPPRRGNPDDAAVPELRFLIDGATAEHITVDGHTLRVYVEDNGAGATSSRDLEGSPAERLLKPSRLVFQARTRAGRDAAVRLMQRLDRQRAAAKRQPGLMVLDRWSHWTRRSDLPARTMDSVIVAGGVLEQLHQDLAEFRGREAEYVRRGIPYHRAYLLSGPPGTGKTSAVKAVTHALGMDLWYAQLSGIDEDVKLVDILGEVRPHGVLLLEDIDSLPAAVTRTTGPGKDITAAGLLNALDGVATPHGLVTILTTNHPERLDPALLRPGRIDRVLRFENPDSATIARHFAFFYGVPPMSRSFSEGRSSAEISEVFKQHLDDPAAAEAELLRDDPAALAVCRPPG